MYSLAYQTGSKGVELLTASGTAAQRGSCRLGGGVARSYEREIKGYLFQVSSTSSSGGIQCPGSSRETLGIIQPLLVVQLQTRQHEKVALEVVIIDTMNQRHRLFFSSSFIRADSNLLHAQLPWSWSGMVGDEGWSSVVLDLRDLTTRFFGKTVEFETIDSLKLYGGCRVRKIFTLPVSSMRLNGEGAHSVEIPLTMDFPIGVFSYVSVYAVPLALHCATAKAPKATVEQPQLSVMGTPLSRVPSSAPTSGSGPSKARTPVKVSPSGSSITMTSPGTKQSRQQQQQQQQRQPRVQHHSEQPAPFARPARPSSLKSPVLVPLRYDEEDDEEEEEEEMEEEVLVELEREAGLVEEVASIFQPSVYGFTDVAETAKTSWHGSAAAGVVTSITKTNLSASDERNFNDNDFPGVFAFANHRSKKSPTRFDQEYSFEKPAGPGMHDEDTYDPVTNNDKSDENSEPLFIDTAHLALPQNKSFELELRGSYKSEVLRLSQQHDVSPPVPVSLLVPEAGSAGASNRMNALLSRLKTAALSLHEAEVDYESEFGNS